MAAISGSEKYLCFGRYCRETISVQQLLPLSSVQFFFFSAVLKQPRAMFLRRTVLTEPHLFFWKNRTYGGYVTGCKLDGQYLVMQ